MTIVEIHLLQPLVPLPGTTARTIRPGEDVSISVTSEGVDVVTGSKRYSYPRSLCVVVSEAPAPTKPVDTRQTDWTKPLGERRPTPGERETMALTADGVPLEAVHAMGGPKPEEPLSTTPKRRRRSKRKEQS